MSLRRVILAGALVAAMGLLAWRLVEAVTVPPKPATAGKPNLVLILTDDQRWDSLSAMPNVRRLLAGHGVTFENAFVTTSLCCPSRASILTGLYSRHTGVFDNGPPHGGAPALDDRSTLAVWLHDAGYRTALIGKYLNGYQLLGRTYIPPGWDHWVAIAQRHQIHFYRYVLNEDGNLVTYGQAPADYNTTVLSGKADEFAKSAPEPFFLYLAPIAPHRPSTPAPQDVGTFSPPPAFHPPSLNEADVADKPWRGQYARLSPETLAGVAQIRQKTLESLQAVDRMVGSLIDTLTARGVLDRTVVMFASDNGYLFGEHRLVTKVWPYEESVRVPLVVRTPWATEGTVDRHLVLNIDLAPTFAQLAGVRPPRPVDGRSFVDLLRGRAPPGGWRSAFVVEYLGTQSGQGEGPSAGDLISGARSGELPPSFEGVRTEGYAYVEYVNGWRELYDLTKDPYELTNLADDPRFASLRQKLAAHLQELLASGPVAGTPAGATPSSS